MQKSFHIAIYAITIAALILPRAVALAEEPNATEPVYHGVSEEAEAAKKTYCVHKVVSATPAGKESKCTVKEDDHICQLCNDGKCPETSRFFIADNNSRHACNVDSQAIDRDCRNDWKIGTCPGGYFEPESK